MERELPEEPLAIDIGDGESRLRIPDLPALCDFLRMERAKGTILTANHEDGLHDPINRVAVTAHNIKDRLSLSTAIILDKNTCSDTERLFRRHIIGGDVTTSDVLHPTTAGYERKAKPTPGASIAVYKAPNSGLKLAVTVSPQERQPRRIEIANYQQDGRRSYTFRPRHIPGIEMESYLEDFLGFSLIALNALSKYIDAEGSLPQLETKPVAELPLPAPRAPKPSKPKRKSAPKPTAPKRRVIISEGVPREELINDLAETGPQLNDIGGYEDVKHQIEKIALSYQHPEIAALWDEPFTRSVLFYGPPGTAKTTLAEIIATESGAKKRIIQSTDIYDMYVSNSAKNMKKLFDELSQITELTVVIFDELESIVSMKGSQERVEAAGVFKREMVRLQVENKNVIFAATTNHRGSMEPALIRAGRFDKHIHVGLPDQAAREAIWQLKMMPLFLKTAIDDSPEVPNSFKPFGAMGMEELREAIVLVANESEGLSGADIEEIFRDVRETKMIEHMKNKTFAPISQDDLVQAVRAFQENKDIEE